MVTVEHSAISLLIQKSNTILWQNHVNLRWYGVIRPISIQQHRWWLKILLFVIRRIWLTFSLLLFSRCHLTCTLRVQTRYKYAEYAIPIVYMQIIRALIMFCTTEEGKQITEEHLYQQYSITFEYWCEIVQCRSISNKIANHRIELWFFFFMNKQNKFPKLNFVVVGLKHFPFSL